MDVIHRDISIEDLVRIFPASVRYLMDKGITCIACGEPIWGTFASASRKKGFSDIEVETFIRELNDLYIQRKTI
jgi:hypothetical protein